MTPIERLEKQLQNDTSEFADVVVSKSDLSALLKCVRALHAFVHVQTDSEAAIHALTAARIEAEKKVGLK